MPIQSSGLSGLNSLFLLLDRDMACCLRFKTHAGSKGIPSGLLVVMVCEPAAVCKHHNVGRQCQARPYGQQWGLGGEGRSSAPAWGLNSCKKMAGIRRLLRGVLEHSGLTG